jgi:hypothetical protein
VDSSFLKEIQLKWINNGLLRLGVPVVEIIHVLIIDDGPLLLLDLLGLGFVLHGHLTHGVGHIILLPLQLGDDVDLVPPGKIRMVKSGGLCLYDLGVLLVWHDRWLRLDYDLLYLIIASLLFALLHWQLLRLLILPLKLHLDLEDLSLLLLLFNFLVDHLLLPDGLCHQLIGVNGLLERFTLISEHLDSIFHRLGVKGLWLRNVIGKWVKCPIE